ncbi:MAG: HEAT repeat domain-containing protein [Candidatus Aminicenantes bacterium]|nr:MAG: HEAT repeat domain-containing protein [Candidatus Aminicenantes bacterium]
MTPFDQFDRILADFSRVEERLFLRDIQEFAQKHPEVVIKTFSVLLKNQDLNIQLKYLVLKSLGELKYDEFVPLLKETLKRENKLQIISEAVNSLAAINSLPAYKVIADFRQKHKNPGYKEKIDQGLRVMFTRNQLVYHFDAFYRDRDSVANIEKSSEFLIKHLPDDYIKELLPAAASRFYQIRYETFRILKNRPNPIYYSTIYYYFKEYAPTAEDELFLMMSEALIINASLSTAQKKIFQKLKVHLKQFKGDKQNVFCIVLLRLNARDMLPYIVEIYPKLDFQRKLLLFENLKTDDYSHFMEFIRGLLTHENNQIVLGKIVEILIHANDFKYLFAIIGSEKGIRKEKLLNMVLGHDPPDIDGYLEKYVIPSQDNQILQSSLQYLLRHAADRYFELITGIFFSGVSPGIKILILRELTKFKPYNQKVFMESIFKDLTVIRSFKKDFLFSLLGVMNEKTFDDEFEEKILSRILVFMEEAPMDDLVNFIYFFQGYEINNQRDGELIINEFRLIRNTLLKSGREQNLARMIHMLIKNIEEKITLKKKSMTREPV